MRNSSEEVAPVGGEAFSPGEGEGGFVRRVVYSFGSEDESGRGASAPRIVAPAMVFPSSL